MAKKKEPSLEEAIKVFMDVITRSSLTEFFYINNTLISKNPKGNSVVLLLEQSLWNGIIDNIEIKDKLHELDSNNPNHQDDIKLSKYTDIENATWIDIDSEQLYSGKVVKLNVEGLEYELSVNKNLIPLKLKKNEFNDISYTVIPSDMTFILRKKFNYPLEDHGFTIMRIFKIL